MKKEIFDRIKDGLNRAKTEIKKALGLGGKGTPPTPPTPQAQAQPQQQAQPQAQAVQPPRIPAPSPKAYRRYQKNRTAHLAANVGMWLMAALDLVFFIRLILSGYSAAVLALSSVVLALELFLVLTLLPVPVLYLGFKGRRVLFYACFFPMGAIMAGWGGTVGGAYAAFFGLAGLLRGLVYLLSFILARARGVGVVAGFLSVAAAAFLAVMLLSGGMLGVDLNARPVSYAYDAAADACAVTRIYLFREGHTFAGRLIEGRLYAEAQDVLNLTVTDAAVVNAVAQWTKDSI
ncbi:MAG: hypothetical protein LBH24_01560 [Clostridiales bacterium]|jgi:hypothetical protein|nr:hypothetical protein [Clostridiales bacterium]